MDITPLVKEGQQIIQSYAAGTFRISGISYTHCVIVTPAVTKPWAKAPDKISILTADNFSELFESAPDIDVVLLGTGAKMEFVLPSLRQELRHKGLAIEVMDTGAACRTYNVLMAEGRRVVALLFLC